VEIEAWNTLMLLLEAHQLAERENFGEAVELLIGGRQMGQHSNPITYAGFLSSWRVRNFLPVCSDENVCLITVCGMTLLYWCRLSTTSTATLHSASATIVWMLTMCALNKVLQLSALRAWLPIACAPWTQRFLGPRLAQSSGMSTQPFSSLCGAFTGLLSAERSDFRRHKSEIIYH